AGLSAQGLTPEQQETLLSGILASSRRRDRAEQIAQHLPDKRLEATMQQLEWLAQIGDAARASGLPFEEPGVHPYLTRLSRMPGCRVDPGPIPRFLLDVPQACQQFRRLIRSEILEELGIVATRSAVAHPDAEVGKARGTVKFRA